jgi:hypothetical protein
LTTITLATRVTPTTGANVAHEIVAELVIERCVDRVRRAHHEQRVAVGSGIHHRLGGDIGARPGPVLDHELLAQPLRQPLPHDPRNDVGRAAGGKADHDSDRTRRIRLHTGDARDSRQRGSTGGQMQECAAAE